MTKGKKILVITSLAAALGVGALGAGTALAAQNTTARPNLMSGLVTAIAQKFNLSPSDVQAVVDQQRQQIIDQRNKNAQQRFTDLLAKAVKDNKLTQAQADLITAKQAEVQAFEASLQGKSVADRQSAMKTEIDSLKAWATANKIPQQYLMYGRIGLRGPGMFVGKMMHGGWGMGRGMMNEAQEK